MQRILLASPVRQTPRVLERFLRSVLSLRQDSFELDFVFVDDNTNPQSTGALEDFCRTVREGLAGDRNVPEIISASMLERTTGSYARTDHTHHWDDASIWKVAAFKDRLIELAIARGYDALFLADSDLVLHPETIEQLLSTGKPIVSTIFWTAWQPGTNPLPQVWVSDEYTLYERANGREAVSDEEIGRRTDAFLGMLRVPGLYPVGGLGACTLIARPAMGKGARFARIDNLSMWGEDRHFCVRARALGIPLFVDTHFPATHLYRDSDVEPEFGAASVDVGTQLAEGDSVSRFVRASDARADEVIFPLPVPWWSRPCEYAWAQTFVEPEHVVLDAACGISHPFKLWLAGRAKATYALDMDSRIASSDAILADVGADFGPPAATWLRHSELLDRIHFDCGSTMGMPYGDRIFNRIFCISVLEHMPTPVMEGTLREFHRTLRDDGLVVLTFDVPAISPEKIQALVERASFAFAGPFEPTKPRDALWTSMYGGLNCFRAVLRKR